MKTPELSYIAWAKAMPVVAVNLARSGVDYCPPSLLRLGPADLVTQLPVQYGFAPLRDAIAARYRVGEDQVFTVSGGTSLANWLACAAALHGCPPRTEVIVEREGESNAAPGLRRDPAQQPQRAEVHPRACDDSFLRAGRRDEHAGLKAERRRELQEHSDSRRVVVRGRASADAVEMGRGRVRVVEL